LIEHPDVSGRSPVQSRSSAQEKAESWFSSGSAQLVEHPDRIGKVTSNSF